MEPRHDTSESKAHRKDKQYQERHVAAAYQAFLKLVHSTTRLVQEISSAPIEKQPRLFMQSLKAHQPAIRFLDKYVGPEGVHPKNLSWRRRALYQIRNAHFAPNPAEEERVIHQVSAMGFQAITIAKGQTSLVDFPAEIRALLPKNIVVKVDEDGNAKRISDRFSNQHDNLAQKIRQMRILLKRYNKIAKKVKEDLRSPDELIALSALVTAIVMETGIRPGKVGQGFVKQVEGEDLAIETFGAITLGPQHVRFLRKNFARLTFPGKKGTINIATLSDPEVLALLKIYVKQARKKGSSIIFITSSGEPYGYKHFQRYFRHRVLSGIAPSDFRKLRATQAILDNLIEAQEKLYTQIHAWEDAEVKDLKERVVAAIVAAVQKSYEGASAQLSHEDLRTTIEQYVNPQVIFRFLSQGRIEDNLRDAILQDKTAVKFDPSVFIEQAAKARRNKKAILLALVS